MNMSNWLNRVRPEPSAPTSNQQTPSSALSPWLTNSGRLRSKDANAPDHRLEINGKCIYERHLPGDAYVTAHVVRLQQGYYDTPSVHDEPVHDVRFIAVKFTFHPARNSNRFQFAKISIALHSELELEEPQGPPSRKPETPARTNPKFLRHAPHLLYGSVSPETLNWNFNMAGSLGVSQTPVTASLSPSGGMRGSYKLYDMMKIQGATRTLQHWYGHEYDIEDGELVWTLEENALQRSGIPREFTFVMLVTKGDAEHVVFDVEIEPQIASRWGHYPQWINRLLRYQPLHKEQMNLDKELGQMFQPSERRLGYNFANLASTFDDFVSMPGTTYSASVSYSFGFSFRYSSIQ